MSWHLDPDGNPTPIYYPDEDNGFLNQVDQGYIGLTQPKVTLSVDRYSDMPLWAVRKLEKAAQKEGLSLDDFVDKYDIILDPRDWDNDAGSGEQAYA